MREIKIGDIVTRKSYGNDTCFKVVGKEKRGEENLFVLKGVNSRLQATAPNEDLLVQIESETINKGAEANLKSSFKNCSSRIVRLIKDVFSFIRKIFKLKSNGDSKL